MPERETGWKNSVVKTLLVALLAAVAAAANPNGDEIARKAAAVVTAQRKVHPRYSFRLVRVRRVVDGNLRSEARYDMRVHMANESIERIEYFSVTQNDRALTATELKQLAQQADEANKRMPRFRAPYETLALAEYDFKADGQEKMANHPCYRIRFRSRRLDAEHGHGLMWVDTHSFNVVKLAYELSSNSAGVRTNRIELYRAPALAELWGLARMYQKIERGPKSYEESAFDYSDFREP